MSHLQKHSLRTIDAHAVQYSQANGFTYDGRPLWIDTGKVLSPYGLQDNIISLELDHERMDKLRIIANKAGIVIPDTLRIYLNRYTRIFDAERRLITQTICLERPCMISVLLNCSTVNDRNSWNMWPSQIRIWQSPELPAGCREY
jgi:hypothetical protein